MSKDKYQVSEVKFVHPFNAEEAAMIAKIILYKRSTLKRILYWMMFFVSGGVNFLLQRWFITLRLIMKNAKTNDPKEADRLMITGVGIS